ncbi:hypothetical protein X777_03893 [Ooceraea biroi]|uniref:Endonuclease/exonuclease/phosphatase domain-containing protein n=1 Tax=Ooceraea biroi TaxID=2015173 RepID=A0A026WK94_OOCBI|nr:hypothetical protein X777_03893 [Ooceraea biroi]
MVLSETWVEGKGWQKLKSKLPKGYVWAMQEARRKSKKGRVMGGMVMGIRKRMMDKGKKVEVDKEGLMVGKIRCGRKRWRVIGMYVNGDIEEKLERLEEWVEGKEEGAKMIIGGDFNARTGSEGGIMMGEEKEEGGGRKSKDGKVREERILLNFLVEKGWVLFNGNTRGDERGEFTFTGGKGCTVIDYIIGDREIRESVIEMRVTDKIDSDHQPVEVKIKGEVSREKEWRGEVEEG